MLYKPLFSVFALLLVCSIFENVLGEDPDCQKINTKESLFDSNVNSITWAGKNVFAITVMRTLWRSLNEGRDWANISQNLDGFNFAHGASNLIGVSSIFLSADPNTFWVLGFGGNFWITTNNGNSFTQRFDSKMGSLMELSPHPKKPEWALGLFHQKSCFTKVFNSTPCSYDLYVSKDLGNSWNVVSRYVQSRQYSWGAAGTGSVPDTFIAFAAFEDKHGDQRNKNLLNDNLIFTASEDLNKSFKTKFDRSRGFIALKNVILIALEKDSTGHNLLVSEDSGETFHIAEFPTDLAERSYTILDTSDGSIVINVGHSGDLGQVDWGNIYISDSFGSEFTLSIEFNRKTNLRCDFHKVKGLSGIYIGNFYDAEDDPTFESDVVTLISSDLGTSWDLIPKPNGVTDCQGPTCNLQLLGNTNPPYSHPNATGIIVANGMTGSTLEETENKLNTYYSHDAGLTWNLIMLGQHSFQFADYGAITVLTDKSSTVTSKLLYSWSGGLDWASCEFTEKDLLLRSIEVPPKYSSQAFLFVGTLDKKNNGVIVHVDFSEIHERQCIGDDNPGSDNDYEVAYFGKGDCLLGQKTGYVRKKQDHKCYNGADFLKTTAPFPCPCTRYDYQCDYCHIMAKNGSCVRDSECSLAEYEEVIPPRPPADCKAYYQVSQGYKLVAGNKCSVTLSGAVNLLPINQKCTLGSKSIISGGAIFMIILFVLVGFILAGIAGLFVMSKSNDKAKEIWDLFVSYVPDVGSLFGSGKPGPSYATIEGANSRQENNSLLDFQEEEAFSDNSAKELDDAMISKLKESKDDEEEDFV